MEKVMVVFDKIDWENTTLEGAHFEVGDELDVEGLIAMARKAIQHVPKENKKWYRDTLKELRRVLREFLKIRDHHKAREWFDVSKAVVFVFKAEICLILPYKQNYNKNDKNAVIPAVVLAPFIKIHGVDRVTIVAKPEEGLIEIYGGGYE